MNTLYEYFIIMNEYFITESLDIPELKIEHLPRITFLQIDAIDHIVHAYKKHPSIIKINEEVKHVGT